MQDLHPREEGLILLTLAGSSILDNVVERVSVQPPHNRLLFRSDRCSPRCVVEECQLTKAISRVVFLEEGGGRGTLKDLSAIEYALLDNVHAVSLVTLTDEDISRIDLDLFNRINNDLKLLFI